MSKQIIHVEKLQVRERGIDNLGVVVFFFFVSLVSLLYKVIIFIFSNLKKLFSYVKNKQTHTHGELFV